MHRRGKGTYVRNSWDWMHNDSCWAIAEITLAATQDSVGLINSGPSSQYLDIYRAQCSMTTGGRLFLQVINPSGATFTPITVPSGVAFISRQNIADAVPSVSLGRTFAGNTAFVLDVMRFESAPTDQTFELANGGPFVRLPPGGMIIWSNKFNLTGNLEAAFWFQMIIDRE